jgi:phosphoribosylformylglycinamidine (FGAM) synthase-like enzyme
VRTLVAGGLLAGAHDVGNGGVGLTLAEMAARSGLGVNVARVADTAELFSESPSRVVLCIAPDLLTTVENVCAEAGDADAADRVSVKGLLDLPLADVVAAWDGRIPSALGSGTAQD